MKKFLPLILLLVGVVVVVVVFFVVKGKKDAVEPEDEETALLNVVLADRPVVSLTPSEDGHYLNLKVEKIVINAESVDYELLYKNTEGTTLGVPGMQNLDGIDSFEAELLLGSESSGKFRYDEGVEEGSMTLRFRNSEGKLLAKFESEFRLFSETSELSSSDGKFKMVLSNDTKDFYVVMHSVGVPDDFPNSHDDILVGPYGVFASDLVDNVESFEVTEGSTFGFFNDKWTNELPSDFDSGIFLGTKSPIS